LGAPGAGLVKIAQMKRQQPAERQRQTNNPFITHSMSKSQRLFGPVPALIPLSQPNPVSAV
jgi:hypothetical protein